MNAPNKPAIKKLITPPIDGFKSIKIFFELGTLKSNQTHNISKMMHMADSTAIKTIDSVKLNELPKVIIDKPKIIPPNKAVM